MNKYIFLLGHSGDLATQEIINLLKNPGDSVDIVGANFVVGQSSLMADELMAMLGGTIKIAGLLDNHDDIKKFTAEEWFNYLFPFLNKNKKNNFGFSLYNAPHSLYQTINRLALSLKKELRAQKYKSRLVSGRHLDLSSVIVATNDLLNKELIIIKHQEHWIFGLTQAVQDFAGYGFRDFDRPARDDRSGMLPPKVAQMMINLTGPDRRKTLLDAFCGSGTIMQEALLLGYDKVIGADASSKAISDSQQNLAWLNKNFKLRGDFNLLSSDINNIAQKLPAGSVDLIVSEPYMGDARFIQRQQDLNDLLDLKNELEKLYYQAFVAFHKILKTSGQVVFVFPIFFLNGHKLTTLNAIDISKIGFTLIKPDIKSDKLSAEGNLVYSRENQIVQREIALWEKGSWLH